MLTSQETIQTPQAGSHTNGEAETMLSSSSLSSSPSESEADDSPSSLLNPPRQAETRRRDGRPSEIGLQECLRTRVETFAMRYRLASMLSSSSSQDHPGSCGDDVGDEELAFERSLLGLPSDELLDRAESLISSSSDRFEECEALLRYFLRVRVSEENLDPKPRSRAHHLLGRSLIYLKRPQEAFIELSTSIELNGEDPKPLYCRGYVNASMGRVEDAQKDWRAAADRCDDVLPDDSEGNFAVGSALYCLKMNRRAIPFLERAIKTSSYPHTKALVQCGNCYSNIGQNDQAMQKYLRVFELNPKSGTALWNVSCMLRKMGKLVEAIVYLDRLVELNPKAAPVLFSRAEIYNDLGEVRKAIEGYSEAIQADPSLVRAWYNRGNAYLRLRMERRAIQDYTQAIRVGEGEHFNAFFNRGLAHERLNEKELAIDDFGRANLLRPLWYAFQRRGNLYRLLGKTSEALQDLEEAIALQPLYIGMLYDRGRVAWEAGDDEMANHDLQEYESRVHQQARHFSDPLVLAEYVLQSDDVLVDAERLTIEERIGAGGQGSVHRGEFRAVSGDIRVPVAVKRVQLFGSSRRREVLREVRIAMEVSGHPNVVSCYGCFFSEDGGVGNIIFELCQGGTIQEWLLGDHSFAGRMLKLQQIVRGMAFLHSKNLVHLDIKPGNIFLAEDETIRIGDFGFSQWEVGKTEATGGTPWYLPPPKKIDPDLLELLCTEKSLDTSATSVFVVDSRFQTNLKKRDVYSFAITAFEILTGRVAFGSVRNQGVAVPALCQAYSIHSKCLRPQFIEGDIIPTAMRELLQKCWEEEEAIRPEFDEIDSLIEGVLETIGV